MKMFTKSLLIASLTLFSSLILKAQSWKALGGTKEFAQPSVSAVTHNSMVRDGSGNLYVAYADGSSGAKLTVQKWTASSNTWAVVGSVGISAVDVLYNSMVVDASGNLYVAYADGTSFTYKLTVQKFTASTNTWAVLGSAGFTPGAAEFISTVIDATGNLYVAYADGGNSYKLTVQKWNGTSWAVVVSAGFSTGMATYNSMAIDASGNLYVAYQDGGSSNKLTVHKWTAISNTWAVVGSAGISTSTAIHESMVIDGSGNLYVAYADIGNGGKLTVQKWTATSSTWAVLDHAGISAGGAAYESMVIDGSGNLYVAYEDIVNGNKLTVQKWTANSNTWAVVGAGVSVDAAIWNSMVVDGSDNLYVAYRDAGNANKLTVQKLTGTNTWAVVGSAGISLGVDSYNSMVKDGSGNVYVAYADAGNSFKLIVQKWSASTNTWSYVGSSAGISATFVSYISMVIDASGNLYVAYQDGNSLTFTLTVQKWNGSNWSLVGGITTGAVQDISMAIDATGNLYVAYADGNNSYKLTVHKWTANSSTWAVVGSAGISAGVVLYNSMVIDGSGNLYVAYSDVSNGSKLTVQKWNGTGWAVVGSVGISASVANYASLVIDGSGNLYVAYSDINNGGKLAVQKWNGSTWSVVGSPGISAGLALYESMVIDGSGNLYVAYEDDVNSSKLTVQKWDGTAWALVGYAGISAGAATFNSTVIDGSGNLYVAYADGGNANKLTVQKLNGIAWGLVGSAGISAGGAYYNSMVKDASGNLYVAYADGGNSGKLTVHKWTASSSTWAVVGSAGVSAGMTYTNSMVRDGSGNLYVAYRDGGNSNKLTVQKWDDSAWSVVGSAGISEGIAYDESMVIDGSGNLYVAYCDVFNSSKLTVQKFTASTNTWATLGTGISAGVAYSESMVIDGSGNLYVAYQDGGNGTKLTVQKWDGNSWSVVGSAGISAGEAYYNSMVIDGSGNLYVAYRDGGNGGKLTVHKWNGSTWAVVGSAGISAGVAIYESMVVDAGGNLYVAYQDGGNSNKLTVQKWDGTAWSMVGYVGISAGTALDNSMVIDGTGNLYVAYQDGNSSSKLTVQKSIASSNTWSLVGSGGISAGGTSYTSMVRDGSGNLYVTYTNGGNSSKLTVQKWSGTAWAEVGSGGISAGAATYNSSVIDASGNLYVAYTDGDNLNKLTVQKWNGTAWSYVGSGAGISPDKVAYNSMVIDASGNLYVVYQDAANGNRLSVQKWNGSNWAVVGSSGISEGAAAFNSMAIDGVGNLYVAYQDSSKFNRLIVQKYTVVGNTWAVLGNSAGISTALASYNSIVVDGSNLYVAYQDGNTTQLTVQKWTGTWSVVGSGFTAGTALYNSMVKDGSGNLYVAYRDGSSRNKLTVYKFTESNSSWSVVGSAGISAGAATYASLVIDGSGNLYVAYSSGQVFAQSYSIGSFYSVATGMQASSLSNWNSSTNNTGSPATSFNSGDNFVVQANHAVTNTGTINLGTGSLVVNTSGLFATSGTTSLGTLTVNSAATATVTGNLQVAGSITNNGGTLNATAGTVTYNGTTAQTIAASTFSTDTIKNLTINNAAGVSLGGALKITGVLTPTAGTFTTGGNLTLTSTSITGGGAIGQGSISGGYISGNVTVQRYSQGQRGYRTIAHPYTTAQSLEQLTKTFRVTGLTTNAGSGTYASSAGNPSAFWYDPTQLAGNPIVLQPITDATSTANWGVGKALYVFVRGNGSEGSGGPGSVSYGDTISPVTINMTGAPINQGNLAPVALTYDGSGGKDNYNLIGNPYPCPINLKALTTVGSFSTVWVYNPAKNIGSGDPYSISGGFDSYTNDGGTDIIIPSLGGFYFKASASGQSISFKETDKVTSAANVTIFGNGTPNPRIRLNITTAKGNVDDVKFGFDATSTALANDTYDGAKLKNSLFDVYSISSDNQRLGIDYRSAATKLDSIIPLGIATTVPGMYSFSLSELTALPNTQIILRDKFLNIETVLSTVGDSYGFTITADAATQGDNRFEMGLRSYIVLPVSIADITAQLQANKTVAVSWTSATELNLAYYHVQRSKDGSNFSTVGKVAATGAGTYSFSDALSAMQPQPTTVYYRLQSVDNNASSAYSKVVSCQLPNATQQALLIYPNPVQATLFAQVTTTKAGSVEIAVKDLQGKLLSKQISQVAAGTTAISVNTASLATGNYVLVVTGADGTQQQQFVKE